MLSLLHSRYDVVSLSFLSENDKMLWMVAHLPSQARGAVHSHAAAGLVSELVLQQVEPVLQHLLRGSGTIFKQPILQQGFILFSLSAKS